MNLELNENTIELIILNKFYLDREHTFLIKKSFDKRYFDNIYVSSILKILNKFYDKYNDLPDINTTKLLLQKLSEHRTNSKTPLPYKELEITFDNALNYKLEKDTKFYQDIVLDFIRTKAIYYTIMDELDNIQENKDVTQCIERFDTVNKISFNENIGLEYFKDLDSHLNYITNPEAKLSFGWDDLDEATNGGVPVDGRCLVLWAGRANIGKSLFLSNLSVNLLKQGKNVIVISLEMSEDMYATRFDAHISDVCINDLILHIDDVKSRINGFKTKYGGNLWIKEFPPSTVNANDVRNYVEQVKQAFDGRIDAVIIDYLNLMIPNNARDNTSSNSFHRVGTITKEVRALSYHFLAPIFSVTQLNRDSVDSVEPDQSMVSESDGINFHSDFISCIYQKDNDIENGKIRNKILKSRFGMVGKHLEFDIDYDTLKIYDATKEMIANVQPTATDEILSEIGDL